MGADRRARRPAQPRCHGEHVQPRPDGRGRARLRKDAPMTKNEWTPRERGLMIGHAWAKGYDGDLADLKPTAEGEISDDTRAAITAMLVESDDLENPTRFWGGF